MTGPPRTRRTSEDTPDDSVTEARLIALERSVAELNKWRGSVAASLEVDPISPALAPEAPATTCEQTLSFLPYVYSAFGKYHRVVVGHPNPPRHWITFCGWHFGTSSTAEGSDSLPGCYKLYCDRCFKEERRMAKAAAEGQVSRVGMVPSEPCHLRDLVA